jgi:hypothetical protein
MLYQFNKTDSGIQGKAFEMAIKEALNHKNANRVSPCGSSDFRYNAKNYEVKQNGTCLQYHEREQYIKGSNRVIYATHIDYTVVSETAETISVTVDLANTQMFVLDKVEFVEYLASVNKIKLNSSRGTANVQTAYNYKKDNYHGKWGKVFEEWAFDHELDDDIIGDILANLD